MVTLSTAGNRRGMQAISCGSGRFTQTAKPRAKEDAAREQNCTPCAEDGWISSMRLAGLTAGPHQCLCRTVCPSPPPWNEGVCCGHLTPDLTQHWVCLHV